MKFQILHDRQGVIQGRRVGCQPQVTAHLDGMSEHVVSQDVDAPGRDRLQAGGGPERGRLAGPVRADHAQQIAGVQFERNAIDRQELPILHPDVPQTQ